MTLTVVGSIAFDDVTTPSGRRPRMLGGSAVHFALAASFFAEVRIVGPVGHDFTDDDLEVLRERGVDVSDVERVPDGETFFWAGEYGWDLNSRTTLDTRLGVFADFAPKLSDASRACDVLFLANIQPDLQREVHAQCRRARWAALDSMDLWIETAPDALWAALAEVDCVLLNDAELRQLTGRPNLLSAAREVLSRGPTAVVAKQGEYGAALVTQDGYFSLPAFPLEEVVDPTGAGDTFAGGLLGYVAAHPRESVGHELLVRAMAYGTALASYNVEEFGTERVRRLSGGEITERVGELERMTRFEAGALALRD